MKEPMLSREDEKNLDKLGSARPIVLSTIFLLRSEQEAQRTLQRKTEKQLNFKLFLFIPVHC